MSTFRATQAFGPATIAASLRANQLTLDSPLGDLQAVQTFDGSAPLIQPRLSAPNVGDIVKTPLYDRLWFIDGTETRDLGVVTAGDLSVSSSLEDGSRAWSWGVVASSGGTIGGSFAKGALGYELDVGGPPPGYCVPNDFVMRLRDETHTPPVDVALLTLGQSIESDREYDSEGHIMPISGGGPEAIYKNRKVCLELAPDHGLRPGEIGILAMQAAQVPEALIGLDPQFGTPRRNPLAIEGETLWSVLESIYRPFGHFVLAGRADGVFREVPLLPLPDEEPVVQLKLTGAAGAGARGDFDADTPIKVTVGELGPTCAVVTGQRIPDDGTGAGSGSGTITTESVVEIFSDNFSKPIAIATQAPITGVIIPTGAGPSQVVPKTLISRVTVRNTWQEGCLQETYVLTEGWFAPQAARDFTNGTAISLPLVYPSNGVFFFDTIPVQDDATEGFFWDAQRFVALSEVWTTPIYDANKVKVGEQVRNAGWLNPEASIKSRATAADPWELEPFTTPRALTAGQQGVLFDSQRYFAGPFRPDALFPTIQQLPRFPNLGFAVLRHLEVTDSEIFVGPKRLVDGTSKVTTRYGLRSGTTQLYTSGTASTDTVVGLDETTFERFTADRGRVTSISGGTDQQGQPTDTTVATGGVGGLSQAEVCDADAANRAALQRLQGEACFRVLKDGVEIDRRDEVLEISSEMIESVVEAEAYAAQELALTSPYEVPLKLAYPIPVVEAGSLIELDAPELGFGAVRMRVFDAEAKFEELPTGRKSHELLCKLPRIGV